MSYLSLSRGQRHKVGEWIFWDNKADDFKDLSDINFVQKALCLISILVQTIPKLMWLTNDTVLRS